MFHCDGLIAVSPVSVTKWQPPHPARVSIGKRDHIAEPGMRSQAGNRGVRAIELRRPCGDALINPMECSGDTE